MASTRLRWSASNSVSNLSVPRGAAGWTHTALQITRKCQCCGQTDLRSLLWLTRLPPTPPTFRYFRQTLPLAARAAGGSCCEPNTIATSSQAYSIGINCHTSLGPPNTNPAIALKEGLLAYLKTLDSTTGLKSKASGVIQDLTRRSPTVCRHQQCRR